MEILAFLFLHIRPLSLPPPPNTPLLGFKPGNLDNRSRKETSWEGVVAAGVRGKGGVMRTLSPPLPPFLSISRKFEEPKLVLPTLFPHSLVQLPSNCQDLPCPHPTAHLPGTLAPCYPATLLPCPALGGGWQEARGCEV